METERKMLELLEEIKILDAIVEIGVKAVEKRKEARRQLVKITGSYTENAKELLKRGNTNV